MYQQFDQNETQNIPLSGILFVSFFMNIKEKQLKLSKKEVFDYCAKNQYATMMFGTAGDDYVASRCCILNALFPGFVLACQATEKLLKAFIYLETGEKTKLTRGDKHNPFKLKEELQKFKNYGLDRFDGFLEKLYDHYKDRYFDNKTSGRGALSSELDELDELWVYLIEALPIPDEVKYRLSFFAELLDENSRRYWRFYEWAIKENKALTLKIDEMEKRYKKVLKHLYPNQ